MASDRISASATVLVLGRDAAVGQALELLLRSAGCNVKFLAERSSDEPGLLDRVQLLLLAPGLSARCREALLTLVSSTAVAAKILVEHLVLWPCRAEDLERRIKATLPAGSEPSQDGRHPQTRQEEMRMVGAQSFG